MTIKQKEEIKRLREKIIVIGKIKLPKNYRWSRKKILKRDGNKCRICGENDILEIYLTEEKKRELE